MSWIYIYIYMPCIYAMDIHGWYTYSMHQVNRNPISALLRGVASRSLRCSKRDWRIALDVKTKAFPRTTTCFELIENDDRLEFDLPRKSNMLAGKTLAHCFDSVDRILRKNKPCIYKIGYTHCAFWRFLQWALWIHPWLWCLGEVDCDLCW